MITARGEKETNKLSKARENGVAVLTEEFLSDAVEDGGESCYRGDFFCFQKVSKKFLLLWMPTRLMNKVEPSFLKQKQ